MVEGIEAKLEVGDRVVESATDEEGIITRLCADESVVCFKRDISGQQEMIETVNLRRIKDGRNKT